MLRLESPPSTQSGPSCSGVRCLVFIQTEAVGPGRRPGSAERQRGLRTRRVDYNGYPEHDALRDLGPRQAALMYSRRNEESR
jgi:hypothetical protein